MTRKKQRKKTVDEKERKIIVWNRKKEWMENEEKERKKPTSNERPVTHNDMKIFIPFSFSVVAFLRPFFGFALYNFAQQIVFRSFSLCVWLSLTLRVTARLENNTRLERKRGWRLNGKEKRERAGEQINGNERERKIMSAANFYLCKFLSLPKQLRCTSRGEMKRSEGRNKMLYQLKEMRLEQKVKE